MQEWEAEKEPNFVANCISQNIETCAKRVPTGLSEVFTPYRVLLNNSFYCHCTSNHWLINNPNRTK